MNPPRLGQLRAARAEDVNQLLTLWELLYDESGIDPAAALWKLNARTWFAESIDNPTSARIPVIVLGEEVVAAAIGTVECGVPNPHCPRGRSVRVANVITLPQHRGQGYASTLLRDVIAWARTVQADRVDLSATRQGQQLYARLGFTTTSAPRMKFIL